MLPPSSTTQLLTFNFTQIKVKSNTFLTLHNLFFSFICEFLCENVTLVLLVGFGRCIPIQFFIIQRFSYI